MKYFKKELWAGVNNREAAAEAFAQWNRNLEKYVGQLEGLRPRLSGNAARFFTKVSLHDATLVAFTAGDHAGRRPAGHNSFDGRRRRTAVLIEALSYGRDSIYTLRYTGIRRASFDFPSDSPLFHKKGGPVDDWGYDELTSAGREYLRHEILFSSGATILIEFKHFTYRREKTGVKRPSPVIYRGPGA